jgi:hypothetical protein
MNLFVSYTRRDGAVNYPMLVQLNEYLSELCSPFIHAVEEHKFKNQQLAVIKALFKSHAILLIESPQVKKSKWVKIELFISHLLMLPIIRLSPQDIKKISHNKTLNTAVLHSARPR